jgi:hypothetical protein
MARVNLTTALAAFGAVLLILWRRAALRAGEGPR